MDAECTTAAVQRYLDKLACEASAEPVIRALLDREVRRLNNLCTSLLYRSYLRLTRAPLNLHPNELLSAVVEGLLKAMSEARPPKVHQFFALAGQHMRWELNDLARRLDNRRLAVELQAAQIPALVDSGSGLSPNCLQILATIDCLTRTRT
ncbi:sigma-70 family RNA polymerase sigma factor [Telmatocola sphagniphila]|uniref:sigma-70 family RNA polymerase sigma factor n=1 Tax=Telmatocola sphagniphila TaxID=1123043 RepID=UPI001FE99CF9|nr:sigma-70 family RNA polymerase sigma factor [Telmatocola sphagniphila]